LARKATLFARGKQTVEVRRSATKYAPEVTYLIFALIRLKRLTTFIIGKIFNICTQRVYGGAV
jgi:hypothetical protein